MDSPYRPPLGASAQRRRWAQSSCREQSLGSMLRAFLGSRTCRIVLPAEEPWSANPTCGARTPFLNATFKNNCARARVRRATS
jgi:hypothetical protein